MIIMKTIIVKNSFFKESAVEKQSPIGEEIKVGGECLFDGRVLSLHVDTVRLPDQSTSIREVIRHKGAVCVIPVDCEGNVTLVNQYRYAVGRFMTEIPAGKLDSSDELPERAALRELEEETGMKAGRLVSLGLYLGSPAILDEKIYMFAALDLKEGNPHPDEGEYVTVSKMKLEEAVDRVLAGEWPDGKTQCAVLRLYQMIQKGLITL